MTSTTTTHAGEIPFEHERRWFPDVRDLPFVFSKYQMKSIIQGYLEDEFATRLRDECTGVEHVYLHTRKTGEGISRTEDEYEIRADEFDSLWNNVKCSLEKDRYFVNWEGVDFQLNIYHGGLGGYLQIEVEFTTAEEAAAFHPPTWFGPEVTHDKRHGNYYLAKFGAPK